MNLQAEYNAELDEINARIVRLRNTVRNAAGGQWQGQSLAYWQEELRNALIERNIWTSLARF